MKDQQEVTSDNGILVVRHTLNGISRNILHTTKSPDEISAEIGNYMAISDNRGIANQKRNKIEGEYVYLPGDFIIEARSRLEALVKGGDEVQLLLNCDAEDEFYLQFGNRVYGFNGATVDAREKELLVTYAFANGLSGPKLEIRTPTDYEVALLNQLSNARKTD